MLRHLGVKGLASFLGHMCLGTLSSLDFDNHLLMVSYTEQARIRKHSTSESLVGSL